MNKQEERSRVLADKAVPWLGLLLLALCLVLGNAWFSVLDDEVAILDQAVVPLSDTLQLFWIGEGQHDHPPLSDILLHGWLQIVDGSLWLLRLPSILFYVAGIGLLRSCAQRLGGRQAANCLVWLLLLWPFGFHYGRLAGWYSFSFFLVSGLTLAYLRFLENPRRANCLWLFAAALALIYTNYYGWAILACLLFDFLVRHYRKGNFSISVAVIIPVALVLAYLPLWPVFYSEALGADTDLTLAEVVYGGFNLYSLFISESVAPWFWMAGIPACVAIAALLLLIMRKGSTDARAYLCYFAFLFALMVFTALVIPRRLLLISPWLLLSISLVIAQTTGKQLRMTLVGLLVFMGAIGWFGIFSRNYYSAPNFIEPWERVANDAKKALDDGAVIVGNHPAFFYYLTQALACPDTGRCATFKGVLPETIQDPRVFDVEQWPPADSTRLSKVVFVRGVFAIVQEATASAQSWLQDHCQISQREKLQKDSGVAWKRLLFPSHEQLQFRIEVSQYNCGKTTATP